MTLTFYGDEGRKYTAEPKSQIMPRGTRIEKVHGDELQMIVIMPWGERFDCSMSLQDCKPKYKPIKTNAVQGKNRRQIEELILSEKGTLLTT